MALVIFSCGTAKLVGCNAAAGSGYLLTALAFGLTIVGMAYCVGNVSGCHINPAVSLGVLMTGGMSVADFVGYVIAQCLGPLAGAALAAAVWSFMSREEYCSDSKGCFDRRASDDGVWGFAAGAACGGLSR